MSPPDVVSQPPILRDLPVPIVTPRLLLRDLRPGDGAEQNAAVLESFASLSPWMAWARERPTLDESESYVRRWAGTWLLRSELPNRELRVTPTMASWRSGQEVSGGNFAGEPGTRRGHGPQVQAVRCTWSAASTCFGRRGLEPPWPSRSCERHAGPCATLERAVSRGTTRPVREDEAGVARGRRGERGRCRARPLQGRLAQRRGPCRASSSAATGARSRASRR